MPLLIESIDAIARQKQRDVLYVSFEAVDAEEDELDSFLSRDWREDPCRQQVCQWLTEQQIPWMPCMPRDDDEVMFEYEGSIYIDVPFAIEDPQYQKVQQYLEYPDGRMRYPGIHFYYLPLSQAMQHADENQDDLLFDEGY